MWWVDPAALDSKELRDTLRALSERRRVNEIVTIAHSEFLNFLTCSLRRHNVARVLTRLSTPAQWKGSDRDLRLVATERHTASFVTRGRLCGDIGAPLLRVGVKGVRIYQIWFEAGRYELPPLSRSTAETLGDSHECLPETSWAAARVDDRGRFVGPG